MPILRVLHLSDLHLSGKLKTYYRSIDKNSGYLSVYNTRALKALAAFVYNWQDRLEAILISGDIAVTGIDSDLKRALQFFCSSTEPTLQNFTKPIIIVPGNHDRYDQYSKSSKLALSALLGQPGGKLFDKYFSSYWGAGKSGVQFYKLPSEDSPILTVICSDFSLEKSSDSTVRFGHYGQGKVYQEKLQNLVRCTENMVKNHSSSAIIWMVHFAPKFEDHYDLGIRMRLLDSEKLIKEAEKAGVKYIFCGHTHNHREYQIGKLQIHCAGTSTCVRNNNDTTIHLRYIDIQNGKVVKIRSRKFTYDPNEQSFL